MSTSTWVRKETLTVPFIVTLHAPFFLLVFLVLQLPEVTDLKVRSNFLG